MVLVSVLASPLIFLVYIRRVKSGTQCEISSPACTWSEITLATCYWSNRFTCTTVPWTCPPLPLCTLGSFKIQFLLRQIRVQACANRLFSPSTSVLIYTSTANDLWANPAETCRPFVFTSFTTMGSQNAVYKILLIIKRRVHPKNIYFI